MPGLAITELGRRWMDATERLFAKGLRASEGRMLLRSGAVRNMTIKGPKVSADICERQSVHHVEITFDGMDTAEISELAERYGNNLIVGVSGLSDIPLFPSADQVHAVCDCSEHEYCRHVAAAIFAVGQSLDSDPEILLRLRGIRSDTVIKDVIDDRIARLMENARKPSDRAISDQMADKLFRI